MNGEISGDALVAIESKLGDLRMTLYDIYNRFDDLHAMFDELYKAQIIIIVMLGIIAGACIFRHLRK